jgi:putative methyltransferase
MKNIYFVQVGVAFGNSVYIPYATGTIIASCKSRPEITSEYAFPEIIFRREKIADALKRIVDPYMVAFSCNIWNIEFNKALAKKVKEKYPDCLISFGGHSVGHSTEFLEKEEVVDNLTFGEGETVFPDMLLALSKGESLRSVKSIAFRENGKIVKTDMACPCDLSVLPSPYLTGVFDELIKDNPDIDFSVILETNRGCPYSCAFCDWTHGGKRMRFFPMEKIKDEILWMAEHKVEFCYGVDSNFGMFERDLDIVDFLVETKRKYGFPKIFRTNYEKNCTDRVFRICKTFNEVGMDRGATVSYQSLSPEALKNIGRKNLTLEHFSDLIRKYNEAGINTYSELILGFPGETYESFCKGICTLLEQGQHNSLYVYLCEILPNAAMSDPEYVKEHKIKTIKVYFKNAHSTANSNDEIHEYSNLVRSTDTMDEDAWVASNLFSICVQCFHSLGILRSFALYLYYEHIADYFTFYNGLNEYLLSSEGELGKLWRDYKTRYDNSLKGNWHYYNPLFGNITWTHEEGAFLQAAYSWDETIKELLPYVERFNIPKDIFEDLLTYQTMIIKKPFDKEKEAMLSYDIPTYFENIYEREKEPLKKVKTVFKISPKNPYDDWEDYAREAIWYGRRKEANIYHKNEYSIEEKD